MQSFPVDAHAHPLPEHRRRGLKKLGLEGVDCKWRTITIAEHEIVI